MHCKIFWQAIVGTVATLLKNHPHDQLATKVPITGAFNQSDVHLWPTIQTLAQRVYSALVPQPDQTIKIEDAKAIEPNGTDTANTNRVEQIGKAGTMQMQTTNRASAQPDAGLSNTNKAH